MTKTDKLNELFDEWESKNESYKGKFVRDGIIHESCWISCKTKILFITKEANQYGLQFPGDFREEWKSDNNKYPFAYRMAEWAYGVINDFPIFDQIRKNRFNYSETLQKISFLNIKKTGGLGISNGGEMCSHFDSNKKYLKKQIDIIAPQIIILCLSWNYHISSGLFKDLKWKQSGYDINIEKHEDIKIIDFYHPSSRTPPSASYSLLENIFRSKAFENL